MEGIKRQHTDTIQDYNNNKKQKLQNQIITINTNKLVISIFEDLANEIVYEIFEYLDINDAYEGFFNLNKRFQNLFLKSNLPIQINISTISKSKFEHYHKNIILPNKHRINILRLSNPFTVDVVFSPPRFISKFIQLETLILDNFKAKYFENILIQLCFLPKLHSLTINPIDYVENPTFFYIQIFRLPKLKYCQIKFETKINRESLLFFNNEISSIEHLIIKNRFRFHSFNNLLLYLPRLRYLSIDCLDGSQQNDVKLSPIMLKNFKYVSLKLELIGFNGLEKIVKNFFHYIENLRLTTHYDPAYLDAKQWEQLIVSSMPNLRVFDINHDGLVRNNSLSYHDLINQFNSSFWTERKWFFTHQHDWQDRLDTGVFHSTDPYRRKDYTFYWELDNQVCSHLQETNLTSVKHIRIGSKKATNNSANFFPNATELTIENYFRTSDNSIGITLNRTVPLKQITKLIIDSYNFSFDQIIELIRFTPNLHTLKLDILSIDEKSLKLIEQSDAFQYVSNRNRVKNLELHGRCRLGEIELFINLFPQLEYFKTGIKRKEIVRIIRYLLSKNNNKTRHLFFLCFSQIPKICLRELNMVIKFENLLLVYFMKFINQDLYLWW